MNDSIFAGLISGLLVTLGIVIFRAICRDTLIPWFENRVYKDIRVEGKWFSVYPTVIGKPQETIRLKRHGHEIVGTIICNSGDDEGEEYCVKGSFRNLIMSLLYETRDTQKVDRGTITLRAVMNGQRMTGKIALYDDASDSIDEGDIIWFRTKADQTAFLDSLKSRKAETARIRQNALEASKDIKKLTELAAKPKVMPESDVKSSSPGNDQSS